MLFIKIILQIAIAFSGFITLYLDHKWHSKPSLHKKGFRILFGSMSLILVISVLLTVKDHNSSKNENEKLKSSIDKLQDSLSSTNSSIHELKAQFGPISDLARERFPSLSEDEAVKNLQEELIQLNEQVEENSYYNRLDLKSKKPEITLIPNVLEWKNNQEDKDGLKYHIQFKMGNIGNRTAHKVQEEIKVLFFDKNKSLIQTLNLENLFGNNVSIPAGHKGVRSTGTITFPKPFKQINQGHVIVYVRFDYQDALLGLEDKYQNIFVWNGFQNDKYKLRVAKQVEFDSIMKNYLSE